MGFETFIKLVSQVFKTLEFLGWYSSGSSLSLVDVEIQKQLMPFNENPIYLLIDTIAASTSRELPISFYESEVRVNISQFISTTRKNEFSFKIILIDC